MPRAHVLVVEDDAAIRRGLCDCLKFAGYATSEACDGEAGLDAAVSRDIDLVLLDLLMPKLDGIAVLASLRQSKPTLPVIILTAKGEEHDRVRGLKTGADDYVVKPFSVTELMARVEAVLRRSPERPRPVTKIEVDGRAIDFARREVRVGGSASALSEKEAEVLSYLVSNRGRAVSRDELLQRVWGIDPRGMQTRTVDMAIARLREVLHDSASEPTVIVTVRGKGYMLAGAPASSGPADGASA
jgi:two-component system, OmpR family, alkaline phosphatase synthesis response regulator PhoP